jgi:hypothetical protein
LELPILDERMTEIKNHLSGFPILLVKTASKIYPNACTENPPDEGDDGAPTYILIGEFLKFPSPRCGRIISTFAEIPRMPSSRPAR